MYNRRMPLNLYRRHLRSGCPAGHDADSQSYETDELRPKWKKCACPIYASGKLGGNPKFRRNTRRVLWSEARAVAEDWERHGVDAPPPGPAPSAPDDPVPPPPVKPRKTIAEAGRDLIKEYLQNRSAVTTVRKYRQVVKKAEAFSAEMRAYVYLDQWTPEDVREWLAWWTGCSTRTQNNNLGYLKSFFEFCVSNQWIPSNPAKFRRPRNRARAIANQRNEKSPYTDIEIQRMLEACDEYDRRYPRAHWIRTYWCGEDLKDFILISVYTGLRISDMATFHISRLSDNGDIFFRAIKNGKAVHTWIPPWLQQRIRERAAKYGPYIFGEKKSKLPVVLTNPWRMRLLKIWGLVAEKYGAWPEPPGHHRFRHTFVRILLQRGVKVTRVAELLGDTEEVVRLAYSRWVPERQDEMRAALQQAFADKPAGAKVVAMRG